MRTLLCLIESPGHVCYRYRAQAFAPYLNASGWNLIAEPFARGVLPFFKQLKSIASADAVVLQRRLPSWWQTRLLRRAAKKLLFDIDDAVFYRDSNNARGHESRRRRGRFAAIASRCDAILCGNAFLVGEAKRHAPAVNVHYFPTCVDPALYPPRPRDASRTGLRLVWIGSRSTMKSLDEIAPQLAEASRRVSGLSLKVVCDAVPDLPGVHVEAAAWSEATEAAELASADVGISILPEHPWSRGKCGLKVLQYMAAGLPVIANRYGVHESMILPGQTGSLTDASLNWAEAIERLAHDPAIREAMGVAGRRRLESEFAVGVWGPRLVDILGRLS